MSVKLETAVDQEKYLNSPHELGLLVEGVINGFDNRLVKVVKTHLINPGINATDLATLSGCSLVNVIDVYREMREKKEYSQLVTSPYYFRKMFHFIAHQVTLDWISDPNYAHKIQTGQPVSARAIEVHATNANCDYACVMCLWSDKKLHTYVSKDLNRRKVLSNKEWQRLFYEAYDMGARKIVFSGGGEPLLRHDLFDLVSWAQNKGMETQLFTNGRSLDKMSDSDWNILIKMNQIRFSIQSPIEPIYSEITGTPRIDRNLERVVSNIREVIYRRDIKKVRVGIGFVTQLLNFHYLESMINFAQDLGVDFLNIRQDEVGITPQLSLVQLTWLGNQLEKLRDKYIKGEYGDLEIDMADDLIALANGMINPRLSSSECWMKYLRPAINPYGYVGPCDLKVEPRFHDNTMLIGNIREAELNEIMTRAGQRQIKADCSQCMPSGRTGNKILSKLITDFNHGLHYSDQVFNY